METFYSLPDVAQFFLAMCAIFAGTILGVVLLARYLRLNDIFPDIQSSKDNIEKLESKVESKIKDIALLEQKHNLITEQLQKELSLEKQEKEKAQKERDKIQKTFTDTVATLNERMDEMDLKLATQSSAMEELIKQLQEKTVEIEKRDLAINKLIEDKKTLEDTKERIESEKRGMLEMARILKLKIDAQEAQEQEGEKKKDG